MKKDNQYSFTFSKFIIDLFVNRTELIYHAAMHVGSDSVIVISFFFWQGFRYGMAGGKPTGEGCL